VLLRESWRENGKTKKRTVGNLSSLDDETVEAVRSALKGDVVPAAMAIAEPRKRLEITNIAKRKRPPRRSANCCRLKTSTNTSATVRWTGCFPEGGSASTQGLRLQERDFRR